MLFGLHWNTSGQMMGLALSILPILLIGLKVTLEATCLGFLLALLLGLVIALMQRIQLRIIAWPIRFIAEFLRDTPLLVQLFFLFYILPAYGLSLPAFAVGTLALGAQYSGYCAEIYRAGIEAIDRGQWEAARALDLDRWTTYRDIILPQAIPRIIPALGTYLVSMIKDAPLLSAISVLNMLTAAKIIGSQTYDYLIPLSMAGCLFLLTTLIISSLIYRLDRWLPKRGISLK